MLPLFETNQISNWLNDCNDFKGRRKYENYHFTYKGNNRIEITDNYKYLGITLFYNENLKHAEDDLYNKVLTEKKAFRSI